MTYWKSFSNKLYLPSYISSKPCLRSISSSIVCLSGNSRIHSFMDKLTSSNLASYVELPQIAVMGDTSSGKSSLLSSIALVELPSSSDLTTRCPIVLSMSKGEIRSATVSINWRDLNSFGTKQKDFDPKTISNDKWETLSSVISDAQQHIMGCCTGKDVSRDMVEVKVVGPDYVDLTLVDLPGIVRSHGKNESHTLRQEINALLEDYLKNERCVILAVVPANVDFHNNQIMADAQKVDPKTKRTIPVITKPDTIDPGAEKEVLDLLQGKKMEFGLGFHMTKGRGQQALNDKQTIGEALHEEEKFFLSKEPWCSMTDKSVFGTAKLRNKLGELQLSMIHSSLPGIITEVNEKREKALEELEALGENLTTVAEKRLFLNRSATTFKNNLDTSLTGKRGCKRSMPENASAKLHCYAKEFQEDMRNGKLVNVNSIKVNGEILVAIKNGGELRGKVKLLEENFACIDYIDEEDKDNATMFLDVKSHRYLTNNADYKASAVGEILDLKDRRYAIVREQQSSEKQGIFSYFVNIPLNDIRTDPCWLKTKIEENRTEDLACFLNVDVFNTVVANFIKDDWEPLCYKLLAKTAKLLQETITAALHTSISVSQHPKLCTLIEIKSADLIKYATELAKTEISEHLQMEMYPYTQDHYLFETISKKRNMRLKAELERCLLPEDKELDKVAIKFILEGTFNRNQRLSIDDHTAEDMEVMLEAYGKVCFKRVIDKSPMICQKMFRSLSPRIAEVMQGITDAELDMVMQKEPNFIRKYGEAKTIVSEMDKAITIFRELQMA